MESTFSFIVALILIGLFIADWMATIILRRIADAAPEPNIALEERARMALVLALASTVNAFLATIRLIDFRIGSFPFLILLAISLILGSVPNLYWLSLYLRNKLRK